MPVSLYGQPADMDDINAIATRHGLAGDRGRGAKLRRAATAASSSCNLSTIGCTSFFPSKPLGCYGDGGAIFTSDDALAKAMREIRVHGQSRRYVHTRIGVGGRMDTLQCAIVLAKLERFEWELEQRAQGRGALRRPAVGPRSAWSARQRDRSSVYAQYTVVLDERDTDAGGAARGADPDRGALSGADAPAAGLRPPVRGRTTARSPSDMAARVMSLPMGPYLAEADVQQVATALLKEIGRIEEEAAFDGADAAMRGP